MRDDSRKDSPPLIKKIDGIPKLSVEPSEKKMPSPNKRLGVMPRLKKPEPDSVPLIPIDEKFKKRWHIEGIIGKGGYGEIYTAIDMKIAEEVAIKAEPMERKGKVARRMILEQAVLVKLQGKPHSPLILGSGHTEKFNYIVLQLLSINLGDIRRMSPTRKLSKSTVGRITVQSIAALRDLHEIGYLHRDVKPANICFGITPTTRHVLKLLDYGLVRRYKEADGEWRQHRAKAGFRGTQRYVSTRVHRRLEQTPADDMVSLMYTAFELLAGELPWRNLEKSDDIWKIKEAVQYGHIEYFSGMARELFDFSKLVSGLDPMVDPPYATLQTCVKKLYSPKKLTDLYDWEENFKEAILEKTLSTDDSSQ
ncbi:Protein CBG12956 [Caenorhabditis briggsae]|nr:Protein CBG12956 [Caenorhabditis briggsae]CAP31839.1 Protein CBG12956 [Caenorhabditis briggsae]